jgi:hypothetical protein
MPPREQSIGTTPKGAAFGVVVPSIHPGGRMSLASATICKTGRADDPDLMFGDLCASALQPMPICQKYEHGFRNRILVGSTEIKMELSAV